jgi:hypothetical protein
MEFKKTNSHECLYRGYKLGNIDTDIFHTPDVVQVSVGCENDDQFYSDSEGSGRVMVLVETETTYSEIDPEHLLSWSTEIRCRAADVLFKMTERPQKGDDNVGV